MSIADLRLPSLEMDIVEIVEQSDVVLLAQIEGVEVYTGDDGWQEMVAGVMSGDPLDILLMDEE